MSERLTLQDLTDLLADKQGVTKKDAEAFLRELIAVISENIEQNDSVKIKDFGTFKLVKVNSRKSVDVNTGEAIEIPAHYKLSFTPEKSLRELLNAPFAHFESVVIEDGVDFEKIKFDAVPDVPKDDTADEEEGEEEVVAAKAVEPVVTAVVEEKELQPENPKEVEENKLSEKVEQEATVEEVIEETAVEHVDETPLVPEEVPVVPVNEEKSVVAKVEEDSEEDDDDDDDMAYLYEDNSKRKWLIIAALFLAIIAISLYVYRDDFFGSHDKAKVEDVITPTDDKSIVDSVAASAAKDTIPATKIEAQVQDRTASVDVKEDHKPKDVITLKTGDTLRKLALKYYGSKTFWVYIYQENQDKIPNFNNVQIGQKIVIPANEKYGIDISDSKSLAKAKALEEKYFK